MHQKMLKQSPTHAISAQTAPEKGLRAQNGQHQNNRCCAAHVGSWPIVTKTCEGHKKRGALTKKIYTKM